MRALGLDVGEKRIGVALSDPQGLLASALAVIERKKDDAALHEILDIVAEYEVECIVIGLPWSLNGSLGQQAQRVEAFSEMLSQLTEVPLVAWDERMSTVAAERLLADAGTSRANIRKHRDAVAAAFILQGYLDRVRSGDSTQA